jgi:endonuclease/exonuclease/phosphatase family metal-dependent hydrolase
MLNAIVNQKLFDIVYYPRPHTPLGIMLLYNRVKFKLIKSYKYYLGININQNFALVAILQENFFSNNFFAIIITHLTAFDKNEKARIKQTNKLFYNLANDNMMRQYKINKIIICGDLNTNPDSECVKLILGNNFKSVFDINNKDDNNYTIVIDTIDEGMKKLKFDYIFISENINIKNKILPTNFLDFEKGLPNENFPSDHIYLFTEFQFCKKNDEINYDFDKIIYDKNLNYELSMTNNNQNINNNKNNETNKNKNNKEENEEKVQDVKGKDDINVKNNS